MSGDWPVLTQRLEAATKYVVKRRRARGRRENASTDDGPALVQQRFRRERPPHWIIPTLSLLLPALAVNALAIWLFEHYDGRILNRMSSQAPLFLLFLVCMLLIARSFSAPVAHRLRVIATLSSGLYPLWLLGHTFVGYLR